MCSESPTNNQLNKITT